MDAPTELTGEERSVITYAGLVIKQDRVDYDSSRIAMTEQTYLRPSRSSGLGSVPAHVAATVNTPGHPLRLDARHIAEARFLTDFSRVRVHSDAAAARSANAFRAHAYTIGDQIVFAEGRYRPDTAGGMRLLTHELAHVVQQRWGGSQTGQAHESDADRAATTASLGRTATLRTAAGVGIALQPADEQRHSVWDTFKPGGAVFEALDSVANPKQPAAKGVMDNLYKRGEALVNAPAAVANLYEKEGPAGVGKAVVAGAGSLVKDTGEAAGDITWEATHYQGPKSAEKIASRAVDVVLNTADLVTIAAGGAGAAKGGISGARAIAEGVKNGTTAISEGAKILRPALAAAGGGITGGEAELEATSAGARLGTPGLKAVTTPPVLTSMAVKGSSGAAGAPASTGGASPGPTVKKLPPGPTPKTVTAQPTGGTPASASDAAALAERGVGIRGAYPRSPLHHVFPQEAAIQNWIASRAPSVNIHDYAVELTEGEHSAIHAKGVNWNDQWKQFMKDKPMATEQDIFEFAGQLMDRYRISDQPVVTYTP